MVHGVGPALGFQGQGTAEFQRFSVLAGFPAVKEIAAVELQAALVGDDFNATSAHRIHNLADQSHPFPVQAPVVVVATTETELLVLLPDKLTNGMGRAEIERRPFHGGNLAGRYAQGINRSIGRCMDGHHIVFHRALTLAAEAEEGMVGYIERRHLVGIALNVHLEIGPLHGVSEGNDAVAREAVLPVGAFQAQGQGLGAYRLHLPGAHVNALEPAVQGVYAVIVGVRVPGFPFNLEGSLAYAVGHRAHGSAQKTFAGRCHVVLQVVVPHDDIGPFSVLVAGVQGYHAGAEIGHLYGHALALKGVQINGNALHFSLKSLAGNQLDGRGAAGQRQCNQTKGQNLFHIYSINFLYLNRLGSASAPRRILRLASYSW